MRAVSDRVRVKLEAMPNICYRRLVFRDHECQGRLTWEHAFTYGGPQIDEPWAIIKICAWAHDVDQFQDGGNLNKSKNQFIALELATEDDFAKYPKKNWGLILAAARYAHAKSADQAALEQLRLCLR